MRVELFRLSADPLVIEVAGDEATVKQIFSAAGSGKAFGEPESTIMDVVSARYGSVSDFGTLRVNASAATLDTKVKDGDTILLIPTIEGG